MIKTRYKKQFDLEERTAKLSESILIFCKDFKLNPLNENIIKQLLRSVTSIGANYMEANGSNSRREFKNKISICKKEAKETTYWLRMLAVIAPDQKDGLRQLWKETQELVLIFSAVLNKLK